MREMNVTFKLKISVIIPLFNCESFITNTIESVMGQTYKNLEIICVDDGSTDNTKKIIAETFPHVLYLYQENKGPSAARNLGIRNSTCDYIAFMDSDDIWFPQKIERQVRVFENDSEVGMVYTNGVYIDEKSSKEGGTFLSSSFKERNDPVELLIWCYIKSPSCVMIKRKVFDEVGLFNENLRGGEDHDMWLRIIEKFKIEYIDEPLIKYRVHDKQLSRYNINMWKDNFVLLKNATKRQKYPLTARFKRMATLYYRMGECNWVRGNFIRAINEFFLAGVLVPFRIKRLIAQGFYKFKAKNE